MEHSDIPIGKVHVPYQWTYANATEREAATLTDGTGKLARQTDNNTLWMLISVSPVTWVAVGGDGGSGSAEVSAHDSSPTAHAAAFAAKQSLHGIATVPAAPTPINSATGLRRICADTGQNNDLTYDATTRTLTWQQTGGLFYYYKGTKVSISSPLAIQHGTGAGRYYVYFADTSGTVTVSTTPWNLSNHVMLGEIYWDGTSKGCCWDERHAAHRDVVNHIYLHNVHGTQWASGGLLSGYTIEGSGNAHVQYALTSAIVFDEDIRVDTEAKAGGSYNVWFKSSGNWTFDNTLTVPYKYGTYIQWNNAGTLTDLQSGEFVNYYLYGTTTLCGINQIIHHVGQKVYGNLADCLNEGLHDLDFTGFPSPETVPMYRLTYMADVTATTTGKATLIEVQKLNGDKNFDPDASVSTRSPDNMTMGRVTAAYMRLQNWM